MTLPRPFFLAPALCLLLTACPGLPTPEDIETKIPEVTPPPTWEQTIGDDTWHGDPRAELSPLAVGCPTELAAPYDAAHLSVGLYWYGPGSVDAPGGVGCRARADGGAIPGYYDPHKPVLIYVHGWQPGAVREGLIPNTSQNLHRDNFWYHAGKLNVADAWLKAGWNVATFHWTQLADDESSYFMPFNSQAKIWTAHYVQNDGRPIGMRYTTPFGYSTTNMPTLSTSELFYHSYRSALRQWDYSGPEPVRIIGHSLGAQMVLGMADQAYRDFQLPARLRPRRLVLADPYWTPATPVPGHHYSYLAPDRNPAERSVRLAQFLVSNGVVIEWIKSSRLLDLGGDNNLPLLNVVSRTVLSPEYLPSTDFAGRHNAAARWYLWTKSTPLALGAARDFDQARDWMNTHQNYWQTSGGATALPGDDLFALGM